MLGDVHPRPSRDHPSVSKPGAGGSAVRERTVTGTPPARQPSADHTRCGTIATGHSARCSSVCPTRPIWRPKWPCRRRAPTITRSAAAERFRSTTRAGPSTVVRRTRIPGWSTIASRSSVSCRAARPRLRCRARRHPPTAGRGRAWPCRPPAPRRPPAPPRHRSGPRPVTGGIAPTNGAPPGPTRPPTARTFCGPAPGACPPSPRGPRRPPRSTSCRPPSSR